MKKQTTLKWRDRLVIAIFVPLAIPFVVCILVALPIASIIVYLSMWSCWNARGIQVLFVHSNSPVWQEHIQQEILPRLPTGSVILNWSERKKWRPSLAAMVFHHFGGYRDFNPLGVVVRPFRRAQVFRFHEGFGDFKHGKPETLEKMESDFFAALKA